MESLQGYFLLASPHLSDGNFFRSVVFMLRHDDEGALGLVLTRPTHPAALEDNDDADELPSQLGELGEVFWGGPVPGPLLALHAYEKYSQGEVVPGVYYCADEAMILKLMKKKGPVRFFVNYSGGGSGQLEDELEAGGWLLTKATAE